MTISIECCAMTVITIAIGAFFDYSNLASFKLDAIGLAIKHFWNALRTCL
jgi:hypothetical protein